MVTLVVVANKITVSSFILANFMRRSETGTVSDRVVSQSVLNLDAPVAHPGPSAEFWF